MQILTSKEDFNEYKEKLDNQLSQQHKHFGEPKQYPCKVVSEWHEWTEDIMYDEYYHRFVYLMTVICPDCGHKTMFWPEGISELYENYEK